jgi:hypothetical protein
LGVTGSARGYGGNFISDRASGARRSRGKRQPNSTESEHPRCQSGDPFTGTTWFVLNTGGAVRCSDGIQPPAMIVEDAPVTCEVITRSISELCHGDHVNDPAILRRWLANKTPEIVASWIAGPGNSVLVAVEGGTILAVGSVTTRARSLSTMCPVCQRMVDQTLQLGKR